MMATMIAPRIKLAGAMVVAGLVLAGAYGVVGSRTHAFAATHGSSIISTGTFNAAGAQTGNSIPNSLNSAAEYTSYIWSLLHNTSWATSPGSDYNKYGAAFLVETMLHGQVNYAANAALVTSALNDYDAWSNLVNQYDSAGRVNWYVSTTLAAGTLNTMHKCNNGLGGFCWDEAVYNNNNFNGGGTDAHQFLFYNQSSANPSTLIVFTNADGSTFEIRRECANVVGVAKPLKQIGWSLGGQTTANKASIFTNDTATFTSQMKNAGPAAASFNWYVRYCWDACAGGYGSGYATHSNGAEGALAPSSVWKTEDTFVYAPNHGETHTQICVWIAYSNSTGSGGAEGHGNRVCVALKPLTPHCGGLTVDPAKFDPTDSYTVQGVVNVAGGEPAAKTVDTDSNFFVHINGPGVSITNDNVTPVTPGSNGADGTLTASISPSPTNNAGKYVVDYGIIGAVDSISCSDSFNVAYTPYFSVMGGDVAAGPGFGSACASELSDITGNNLGGDKGYYGAGSQLAALSLGRITNFATNTTLDNLAGTGSSSSGGSALRPSGLAFSNLGTAGTVWGNSFGRDPSEAHADNPSDNSSWCAPNYVSAASDGATAPKPLGTNTLDQPTLHSLTSGVTYSASGTVTIAGPLTLGGGNPSRITLVVDSGDVIIKGGLTYSGYSYVSGSSTVAVFPQFQLLVRGGNIYIDQGVTTLDGFYHAQRSGSKGGSLYTCAAGTKYLTGNSADGAGNASHDDNYYDDCSQPLTIYGSVAAKHIGFLRTGGNWKQTPLVGNQPAEQIVYAPELWLGDLDSAASGPQPYDSITSLAPIF